MSKIEKVRSELSVTRLGDFWNFLATNFVTKVAQMFCNFMGSCKNHYFLSQAAWQLFGQLLKNLDYFLFQYLVILVLMHVLIHK